MLDLDRSCRTSRRRWLIVIMLDPVPDGITEAVARSEEELPPILTPMVSAPHSRWGGIIP
jgi:hypothetical protein